jgi:hypothetical protein
MLLDRIGRMANAVARFLTVVEHHQMILLLLVIERRLGF